MLGHDKGLETAPLQAFHLWTGNAASIPLSPSLGLPILYLTAYIPNTVFQASASQDRLLSDLLASPSLPSTQKDSSATTKHADEADG